MNWQSLLLLKLPGSLPSYCQFSHPTISQTRPVAMYTALVCTNPCLNKAIHMPALTSHHLTVAMYTALVCTNPCINKAIHMPTLTSHHLSVAMYAALVCTNPCINKAIHMLFIHRFVTFNKLTQGHYILQYMICVSPLFIV